MKKNNDIEQLKKFVRNTIFAVNSNGKVPFILKQHQSNILHRIHTQGDSFIISKSRQVGITSLFGLYSIWNMILDKHSNHKSLIVVPNISMARAIIKVLAKFCKDINLRGSLPNDIYINTKTADPSFQYEDNSIYVLSSQEFIRESIRLPQFQIVFLDEFAYMKNQDDIMKAISLTFKKDAGKICIASTPNNVNNIFTKLFYRALRGESLSIPIQIDWGAVEDMDDKWRQDMNRTLGIPNASIEYDGLVTLNQYLRKDN